MSTENNDNSKMKIKILPSIALYMAKRTVQLGRYAFFMNKTEFCSL